MHNDIHNFEKIEFIFENAKDKVTLFINIYLFLSI